MKAFRNMNLMQGHIIRKPKKKDLMVDTSDEDDNNSESARLVSR